MELSKLIGVALLGGIAAAATGGIVELIRALLNPGRRAAIMHRTFRDNLEHFLRSPRKLTNRQ